MAKRLTRLLPSDLREIAKFCRDELSFDYLLDITSIDNFGEEPRFEIVYHLYSMPHGVHLRLKLKVPEESARSIPFRTSGRRRIGTSVRFTT